MTNPLRIFPAKPFPKWNGKSWRALVALISILAFLALVSASVSHIHQTNQETQECSICSVVTDKVGSSFAAPALMLSRFVLLFSITVITLCSSLHASALLLPRSCGPPTRV